MDFKLEVAKIKVEESSNEKSQPRVNHVMDTPFSQQLAEDPDNLTLKNNGGVAKQYDVVRWRRYLALWRSILYVVLRTWF